MGVVGTSDWWLAVDFGAAATVAADVDETIGAMQSALWSHQVDITPSAVHVSSAAQIDVGVVARNRANDDPDGFVAAPKRYVSSGESHCRVGLLDMPVRELVAAVLHAAATRAQRQHPDHPPNGVVLTHPEYWRDDQRQVLVDAAADVGFPSNTVRTVSEPTAAALHYSQTMEVRGGDHLAVIDCGAGTLDVTVLEVTADGSFRVVAARGERSLGGHSIDESVRRWVIAALRRRNPELSARLHAGEVSAVDDLALDDAVRQAKELLSETTMANIDVRADDLHEQVVLTRREFDDLISADVHRALVFARATFVAAGITRPAELTALYLTGGSSRIPLLRHRFAELGHVAAHNDVTTAVAHGALMELAGFRAGATPPPLPPILPARQGPNQAVAGPNQAATGPTSRRARQSTRKTPRGVALAGFLGATAFCLALASAIALGFLRGHHSLAAQPDDSSPRPVSSNTSTAQPNSAQAGTEPRGWADPVCAGLAGDLVTSHAPGDQNSPVDLAAAAMYARYVTRDAVRFTGLYSAAPPADAVRSVIDAAPTGTRYCVAATVTGPHTVRVVLRQQYPGMAESGVKTETWTVSPSAPYTIDHVSH
jgi:hypothetical protein